MRNLTIAEGLRRLRSAGLVQSGTAHGCTSTDIARIEAELGQSLPAAYKEFLAQLGRSAGAFLRGSDFSCDQLGRINREAKELVREHGLDLPRAAVVFLMHQGYQFLYFHAAEGDDPEVHRFEEGGPLQRLGVSFSTWFLNAADDEIRIVRGLGR